MDITSIIQTTIYLTTLSLCIWLLLKIWRKSRAIFILIIGVFLAPSLIFLAGFASDSGTKEAILTATIMSYTGFALIPICLIYLFVLIFKQLKTSH